MRSLKTAAVLVLAVLGAAMATGQTRPASHPAAEGEADPSSPTTRQSASTADEVASPAENSTSTAEEPASAAEASAPAADEPTSRSVVDAAVGESAPSNRSVLFKSLRVHNAQDQVVHELVRDTEWQGSDVGFFFTAMWIYGGDPVPTSIANAVEDAQPDSLLALIKSNVNRDGLVQADEFPKSDFKEDELITIRFDAEDSHLPLPIANEAMRGFANGLISHLFLDAYLAGRFGGKDMNDPLHERLDLNLFGSPGGRDSHPWHDTPWSTATAGGSMLSTELYHYTKGESSLTFDVKMREIAAKEAIRTKGIVKGWQTAAGLISDYRREARLAGDNGGAAMGEAERRYWAAWAICYKYLAGGALFSDDTEQGGLPQFGEEQIAYGLGRTTSLTLTYLSGMAAAGAFVSAKLPEGAEGDELAELLRGVAGDDAEPDAPADADTPASGDEAAEPAKTREQKLKSALTSDGGDLRRLSATIAYLMVQDLRLLDQAAMRVRSIELGLTTWPSSTRSSLKDSGASSSTLFAASDRMSMVITGLAAGSPPAAATLAQDASFFAYSAGYDQGYEAGYSEGFSEGYKEGHAEAWAEANAKIKSLQGRIDDLNAEVASYQQQRQAAEGDGEDWWDKTTEIAGDVFTGVKNVTEFIGGLGLF